MIFFLSFSQSPLSGGHWVIEQLLEFKLRYGLNVDTKTAELSELCAQDFAITLS